ncbi:MAG TPA: roadblock/LC7 domain-containing protein [Blastocatellia bacterium]|nr:roadblock/LC7 domain-containing protein [Blastocatellia bacterium]
MPFKALLMELVSAVEGAEGAIFMDAEGEAVQWHARGDAERLRLRAAYIAVVLQTARASVRRLELGSIGHLVVEYEGARFVVSELGRDYLLLLELNKSSNVAEALFRIQPAAARLRQEVAA